MDAFLENAQRIFDVARADDSGEPNDFALVIRPDGGLHFVMESPLSLVDAEMEAAGFHDVTRIAYRVTKTSGGVRVEGRDGNRQCVLSERSAQPAATRIAALRFSTELLRDQPLYWISSPLTLSASS